MVDADFGVGGLLTLSGGQFEQGAELLRPSRRVPLDAKALQADADLGFTSAVQQLQFISGGKKAFHALAAEGAPGSAHHQNDQSGVNE